MRLSPGVVPLTYHVNLKQYKALDRPGCLIALGHTCGHSHPWYPMLD